MPDEYLEPCLAAIEELAESYGSTIVLCTATQPALEAVWPFGHSAPTEIVPSSERHTDLFESRVQIENIGEISVDSLADRIIDEPEVLCIVSTRGAAYDLYQRVADSGGTDWRFSPQRSYGAETPTDSFRSNSRETRQGASLPCHINAAHRGRCRC